MSKIGVKFIDGGKVFNIDSQDDKFKNGDKVVVESIRGIEIATITAPSKEDNVDEIKSVLRLATDEDIKKSIELKKQESKVISLTNELIKKFNLQMKLVDVSFTLDGSKVIINYVCDDRVDFRELVKELASQLKLRIELRQIGIRDQAKKIGGIGFCGKECCCKKYLNDFDKVSIKMAKTQGLSLNPTKISGICGRLMCCLSYENDFYSEVSVKMPKLNSKVKTKDGVGSVIYNNLLKQTLTVKIESDNDIKISEYALADIEILPKENIQQNQKKDNLQKNNKQKNIEEKHSSNKEKVNNIVEKNKKSNNFKKFENKENESKK